MNVEEVLSAPLGLRTPPGLGEKGKNEKKKRIHPLLHNIALKMLLLRGNAVTR